MSQFHAEDIYLHCCKYDFIIQMLRQFAGIISFINIKKKIIKMRKVIICEILNDFRKQLIYSFMLFVQM